MRILRAVALLTSCFAFAEVPAFGATVRFRTDAELVTLSERVVHARAIAQRTERGPLDPRTIYTVTTFEVIEDFTGRDPDVIDVWELGGVIGNEFMFVGGAVAYRVGEEVLVCLERGRYGLRSVAMGFSAFDVRRTTGGDGLLRRRAEDTIVVGGTAPARERSLAEFRRLAFEVKGARSRRAPLEVSLPLVTVEQPFATLGNFRWIEADSGIPIAVYKNSSAAPPIASGDGVPEIQTALAAWTNPASASIALRYAGTTLQSNPRGTWPGLGDGTCVITFEDPNRELSGSTLAIGGGSGYIGGGGIISGTEFNRLTSGFVILQNAADLAALSSTYTQSLNFTRIIQHETGHAIGFAHTPTDGSVANPPANIMNASCCSNQTPVPPALGPDDVAVLTYVYPAGPQGGPGSSAAVDPSALQFSATTTGTAFSSQTGAQDVHLTVAGSVAGSWTATPSAPWIVVSPTSGTGSATLTVSVQFAGGLPASGSAGGSIDIAFANASATAGPVAVTLMLTPSAVSTAPFGAIDTPLDHAAGVAGSIAVTGWALDNVEVSAIRIYRDPVAGETPGASVFLGNAVLLDGARPDVAAVFPTTPFNTRAGWGFLMLTNVLPNQGNGLFRLYVFADDREGHTTLLGTRTITCANSTATNPFGAIDSPAQNETISGTSYHNFGWVLGPGNRRADVPGGGTVTVLIDGVAVGTPSGWTSRPDVAALFPVAQYSGVNFALAVYTFNPATLANGVHTISWAVTDNLGGTAGVGSRYFTVANGTGVSFAAPASQLGDEVLSAPLDTTPVSARRAFNFDAPFRRIRGGADGRLTIHGEELDRFEVRLAVAGAHQYTGYVRAGGILRALPIGSWFDEETGVFVWQPGAGFVGAYDLVFVRWAAGHAIARQELRVVLNPKGSGRVGPQVMIDTPTAQQEVGQPFTVAGWAIDLDADGDPGVDAVHVWAYPLDGSAPLFVGQATSGGARPDVAAVHGDGFRASGYSLTVTDLGAGTYDVAVFAHSRVRGGFVPARVVRVTVR